MPPINQTTRPKLRFNRRTVHWLRGRW